MFVRCFQIPSITHCKNSFSMYSAVWCKTTVLHGLQHPATLTKPFYASQRLDNSIKHGRLHLIPSLLIDPHNPHHQLQIHIIPHNKLLQ
uniref:Uncharacterized protein n=1 Tax=Triticum urartu TaxID=4572 RepID=A0A8R7UQG8_TRIUA